MSVYLSTSCYGRISVSKAISACQKIAGNFIEISAPHDYQSIDELKTVLEEFKNKGVKFSLHNYFPAPKSSFVLKALLSRFLYTYVK